MIGECVIADPSYARDKDGYPRVKWGGKIWRLNRMVWALAHGRSNAEGRVVAHKCNIKACIKFEHLYLATSEQNSHDAKRDGLYRTRSNGHPNAKISDEILKQIRRLYDESGISQAAIGLQYGVSQSQISYLLGKSSH